MNVVVKSSGEVELTKLDVLERASLRAYARKVTGRDDPTDAEIRRALVRAVDKFCSGGCRNPKRAGKLR